jgi:hypothetical protein
MMAGLLQMRAGSAGSSSPNCWCGATVLQGYAESTASMLQLHALLSAA